LAILTRAVELARFDTFMFGLPRAGICSKRHHFQLGGQKSQFAAATKATIVVEEDDLTARVAM